ncbi:MAG: beta-ketoacyl synthase N-terminal-like domain-containing protein, partial [Serratia marcescens]|nr:beta-ketoacyl synthase N-terminal-like domain-containing protein [Serratia marcescens]
GLHRALSLVGLSSLPADARTVGDVESESASRISSSLPSLAAIAMTSQCGRQAFACRLALVVSSLEELSTALDCVAQGESHPSVLTKPADAASLSFMLGADFTTSFAADALAHHRWEDVARLWVAGVNVDWEVAWQHSRPTRASLPLYPFREGSCWLIPVGAGEPLAKSGSASEASEAPVVTKPVHRADVSEIVLDVFSTVLAIPRERLTSSGTLEGYGVDSILVRQLLTALEEVLPGIPVSLMFEAETVGDVVQAIQRLYPDGAPEVPSSTQQSRCEVAARTVTSQGDIAVIGMAGRFPGASDVDALARRLIAGDDLISEVPAHRWDWTRYPDHQVRWGGFISDERCFDAEFFGISPSTAAYLDPQERVLLECAWHCVSDAGYVPPAM